MRVLRLLLWFPVVAVWVWVLFYGVPMGLRYWEIRQFSHQVEQACIAGQSRVVLADLTEFDWDQVVIFPPYVSRPWTTSALGYRWDGYLPHTELWTNDTYAVLLFLKNGRIVHTQLHWRRSGEFPYPMRRISRAEAVFVLPHERGNCEHVRLRLDVATK